MAEAGAAQPDLSRSHALERALVRVRWFAVAFGLFQAWQLAGGRPAPPNSVVPATYATVIALALGNLVIARGARRATSARELRRIGTGAFALDTAVILANVWIGSYDRNATGWTLAYILPLEGAIRYQLRGAVASFAMFSLSEIGRELYRAWLFPDLSLQVSSVTFRVGVFTIIALVAGIMARSLERERGEAEGRAVEIQAFHDVILAGISGGTLEESVDRIAESIAGTLGYEIFAIRLLEERPGGTVLRCVGARGFPEGTAGRTLPVDRGIVGRVIATGASQLVADTGLDPDYVAWHREARSEMAVPLQAHGRLIGVVDVESGETGRFSADDLSMLERLASQIGLVISNARLLATERATVERLRELDTMKTDFVAVTSHELRTPLTSIQGFIKTIRRPDLALGPGELQEFLAIVDRQTERLSRLVEGLLLTARIDAGTIDLQMESVEVSRVLGETLEDLEPGRSRVQLALDPGLPRMVTDGQRLGQIARNLIENALKFSPDDSPVRVTAVREDESLLLEVSDRGSGIEPAELPHIFDRFHQVGGSMRRRGQGLGLGLYIVRNLVEALNGRVTVRSAPGEGSTFAVRIPIVAADQASARGA
jgi:signal transduction histidine kinase